MSLTSANWFPDGRVNNFWAIATTDQLYPDGSPCDLCSPGEHSNNDYLEFSTAGQGGTYIRVSAEWRGRLQLTGHAEQSDKSHDTMTHDSSSSCATDVDSLSDRDLGNSDTSDVDSPSDRDLGNSDISDAEALSGDENDHEEVNVAIYAVNSDARSVGASSTMTSTTKGSTGLDATVMHQTNCANSGSGSIKVALPSFDLSVAATAHRDEVEILSLAETNAVAPDTPLANEVALLPSNAVPTDDTSSLD